MGLISRLFGVAGNKRRAASAKGIQEQRRQLGKRLVTPEREALIARAMEVRRAKQDLLGDLAGSGGPERVAEVLRRMLEDKR